MKNNKFAKISVLILALALCLGAAFAMTASASAEDAGAKPEILSQNVMYTDQFCLMYAVDASSAKAPVTLNVYRAIPGAETPVDKDYVVSKVTTGEDSGLGKDAYIFTVQGVGATELTSEFYVQAVDADGNKSDLKGYSVAEYLYQRLASGKASEAQKKFYNDTINFGATAQAIFAPTADRITDYRYVTVNGGTIDYINEAGVYVLGNTITPKADNAITATWNVTTTAADGTTITSTVDGSYKVTDAVKTEFSFVSAKYYRSEAETFEGYTVGTSPNGYIDHNYGNVTNYKYTDAGIGHNKVISATISATSSDAAYLERGTIDTTIATADTATAAEISFDIRLTCGSYGVNLFNLIQCNGTRTVAMRPMFYITSDNQLRVRDANNINNNKYYPNVSYGEWFHIRMVTYKGDTHSYIYINGSDDYFVCNKSGSYAGDLSTLSYARFEIKANIDTFEIDNFFYGYTMDTLPAAN